MIVLMDDALAMENGARILGPRYCLVNADGYKKSIPYPTGNYYRR